jgi:hypothetical protein
MDLGCSDMHGWIRLHSRRAGGIGLGAASLLTFNVRHDKANMRIELAHCSLSPIHDQLLLRGESLNSTLPLSTSLKVTSPTSRF